jgi:hypothetical protein
MTRQPWTVHENELAIDLVFSWFGLLPWTQGVPPTPWVTERSVELNRKEPQHSARSWEAKIRDIISCLPLPTQKAYAGRPAGSTRTVKSGAKSATVQGPSTQELVAQHLRELEASRPADLVRMIGAALKDARSLKQTAERMEETLQVLLRQMSQRHRPAPEN